MSGEITKALNDMARDAEQCKRLKAENKRVKAERDRYRKALERIAKQGLGAYDDRQTRMGATGEPWVHWAAIAHDALGKQTR